MTDHAEAILAFVALFRTTELPAAALGAWMSRLAPFAREEVRASLGRLGAVGRQVGTPELPKLAVVLADLRGAQLAQTAEPPRHNDHCDMRCRDGQVLMADDRGYQFPAACRCWAGRQWSLMTLAEAGGAGLRPVPHLLAQGG